MIINVNTGEILVKKLHFADSFLKRFWGLLRFKRLIEGEGMIITPCKSIHTFFMRFSIDVIYLDSAMRVVAISPNIKPWRVVNGPKNSQHVLEMKAGTLVKTKTKIGHYLKI